MPNDYTKDSIKAAFIRLLNERPLNKISVKSIVDICNISRNTFYYHFQDIPGLLEEIIIDSANTLVREHDTVRSMGECIESAFAFVKANKKAVYHIYNSVDRAAYEDFVCKMCDHTATLLVREQLAGQEVSDADRAALTYFVKCQFIGLCMDWTRSGMNDDIADKYHRSVALITDLSRNPSKLF
ncbi:MAG: TetR/AcrR family transcriptional regulator C-terminal domain-containing protein [Eubacteriales bacterium]|nr:TetR/AcrR family transcriptional regulator C-terminal domain-containing protein [Eubacteriales bacterium]